MPTWKKLPKWILPPPAGAVAGWATAAAGGAPAPAAWTLAGIAAWCSVPYHWAFIAVGVIAGTGSFLGLRAWLDDRPVPAPATAEDMERVLAELAALKQQLSRNPNVSDSVARDFGTAADELARSDDPGERAAAVETAEGDPVLAADRLMEELNAGKARNAERARRAARIYAPFAPGKALEAYAEAVDLDPEDIWSWIALGRLRLAYGTLADARNCFGAALQRVTSERDRMALHNEFGNVLMIEGTLPETRFEYEAALAIAEKLPALEPGNGEWQRDLFVSHVKLAALAEAEGRREEAPSRFGQAERIMAALAGPRPDHPGFARDLAWLRSEMERLRG